MAQESKEKTGETQDIAFRLAEHAAALTLEKMSGNAIAATKRDIFDSLATGIAGCSAQGVKEMIELAEEWGGAPQATIFGFGKKFPAQVAAWINTVMIHGYDYDDTHDTAMLHSGAIVVSTALAAAERQGGVKGADLLAGIAAGLDIHVRLGLATTIGLVESGWIYTELLGIFAGVAAAGRVMGLTKDQMVNAFGIAYSQAAGNYQTITDSAWTKRIQPGFASHGAIVSCEMARKGIRGVQNTFEGRFGFYHNYVNNRYNPEPLRDGLGVRFAQEQMDYKPWPCGRPLHPPINAALEARERFHIDAAMAKEIQKVEIHTNEHLFVCGFIPDDVRKHPVTVVDGQFSIPYTVAAALIHGKVGLADFTPAGVARPEVLELCAKVEGVVDPEIEKNFRAKVCPCRVRIQMKDGKTLEHYMRYTLGCGDKPMKEADFVAKMEDCVAFSALPRPAGTTEKLRALVNGLETLENSNAIVQAMLAEGV